MRFAFGFLTLFSLLCLASCNKETNDPNTGLYLFLEQHTAISGELISGPEPPLLQIDFPTYNFHEESGQLDGIFEFQVDDRLKMIYGSGTCLSGTAGGGCGTGLSGVYEVPFERDDFELLKLDDTGNVVFMYQGEVHSLKPGEEWIEESSRHDSVMVENELSVSEITTTERISNFGLQSKANIQKWEW